MWCILAKHGLYTANCDCYVFAENYHFMGIPKFNNTREDWLTIKLTVSLLSYQKGI